MENNSTSVSNKVFEKVNSVLSVCVVMVFAAVGVCVLSDVCGHKERVVRNN